MRPESTRAKMSSNSFASLSRAKRKTFSLTSSPCLKGVVFPISFSSQHHCILYFTVSPSSPNHGLDHSFSFAATVDIADHPSWFFFLLRIKRLPSTSSNHNFRFFFCILLVVLISSKLSFSPFVLKSTVTVTGTFDIFRAGRKPPLRC